MSNFLWPYGLQQARLPCPSLSPRVCSNSCPLSWWCHPAISSSVAPFSSGPQSSPGSGSFLMSRLLASGGQSIGASASALVLPMSIQGWFPLGLTDLISLLSEGLSRVFSSFSSLLHSLKPSVLQCSVFFVIHSHIRNMTTGKTIPLTIWTFTGKVISLLFNMLSGFVIVFLPRSKHLLILKLQSPFTVILEPKKIKSVTVSIFFPPVCHEVMKAETLLCQQRSI